MAPPPPANLPFAQRMKMLAQTLQFTWFLGHFLLLCSVFRYAIAFITFNSQSTGAQVGYRLAFAFAAVTYGIVVYKAHFSHGCPKIPKLHLLLRLGMDENVQYLIMALVWLYAREITFALVPFAIYSIFHVASYSRSYLIPTIFPPTRNSDGTLTQHVWIDSLSRFVKTYHDASMSIVAQFELMVLVRLFFTAFSFQTGSMLLFGVYAMFYRFRYHNSIFVKAATAHAEARVDTALSHRSTPNWIRGGWEVFKKAVAKAYWALDLERYVSEQPRKDH
ncbi:endoplasmic reticulum protein [Ascosphaera apis ARSEF 7405]|uniref:Endoplasmic reticulum protein n=1 Tax=Ascosphaera apis ARSEF 7405 TaxID=392613 RepID=A0A167UZ09_9EURO|nr:endoplasmic reticulum protein [Ascosphaera apis ARSEF 7405]